VYSFIKITSMKLSCVLETMYITQLITRWQYYPSYQSGYDRAVESLSEGQGFCLGQRSVVPPLQPATPILSALSKFKININLSWQTDKQNLCNCVILLSYVLLED